MKGFLILVVLIGALFGASLLVRGRSTGDTSEWRARLTAWLPGTPPVSPNDIVCAQRTGNRIVISPGQVAVTARIRASAQLRPRELRLSWEGDETLSFRYEPAPDPDPKQPGGFPVEIKDAKSSDRPEPHLVILKPGGTLTISRAATARPVSLLLK